MTSSASTELELPFDVLRYVSDPRDWTRMEGIGREFRKEIQTRHWARVHSLSIGRAKTDTRFSVAVKKGKSSANGGEFVVRDQLLVGSLAAKRALDAVRAVSKRANNLKQLRLALNIHCLSEDEIFSVSEMLASLRQSASSTLNMLTWNFGLSRAAHFRILTHQMAELMRRFFATLTEIRFQMPMAPLPLYRAIGHCTAINTLKYVGDCCFSSDVIAMLRNKSALKKLKLPEFLCNARYEEIVSSFLASGAQLNELDVGFKSQMALNSFLTFNWSLAQHVANHPLFSVTSLHLRVCNSDDIAVEAPLPSSPTTLLDVFPNLNKLNCARFILYSRLLHLSA